MAQRPVQCCIIRGGTSKGVYIERSELPPPGLERDQLILKLYGSPDKRQIDGLGGADKLTSKVAIMGPPTRPDCDVDYHFGKVNILLPKIDWTSNCGNLSSGAAIYAVHKGYVKPTEPFADVAIHVVNTGNRLLARVPVADGEPATEGDFQIGGVPGTGAKIDLDFQDFAGCILKRGLLPTGSVKDSFNIPGLGMLELSIVDMANLCVFVRASDVGLDHTQSLEALQSDRAALERLESIRAVIALEFGLATREKLEEIMRVKLNPTLFILGTPRDYTAVNGEHIEAESTDLFARCFNRWAFSKAYQTTGSTGTGVASVLPGTIASELVRGGPPRDGEARQVRIGHPGGTMSVEAAISKRGGLIVTRATVGRTARLLMEGTAFVRK